MPRVDQKHKSVLILEGAPEDLVCDFVMEGHFLGFNQFPKIPRTPVGNNFFIHDELFFIFLSQDFAYKLTGLKELYAVINIIRQEPDPLPLILITFQFLSLKTRF